METSEEEEESSDSGEEEEDEWEWEETYTYTEWFPPDFWKVKVMIMGPADDNVDEWEERSPDFSLLFFHVGFFH